MLHNCSGCGDTAPLPCRLGGGGGHMPLVPPPPGGGGGGGWGAQAPGATPPNPHPPPPPSSYAYEQCISHILNHPRFQAKRNLPWINIKLINQVHKGKKPYTEKQRGVTIPITGMHIKRTKMKLQTS